MIKARSREGFAVTVCMNAVVLGHMGRCAMIGFRSVVQRVPDACTCHDLVFLFLIARPPSVQMRLHMFIPGSFLVSSDDVLQWAPRQDPGTWTSHFCLSLFAPCDVRTPGIVVGVVVGIVGFPHPKTTLHLIPR